MLPYIITAVVSIIITALIVWFAAALYQKKSANSKIGNAEEKARGIIDEAVKTAEEKKRSLSFDISIFCFLSSSSLTTNPASRFSIASSFLSTFSSF